jgi:transposase
METPPNLQVYDLGHLGLVASVLDRIRLVETVDRLVGPRPGEKVSTGMALKAALLNALGFVASPLYLFGHPFQGKPTEHLLGPGITPDLLNDDRMGRMLDTLYTAGVTEVFLEVAREARRAFPFPVQALHVDSTSFHVYGQYEGLGEEVGAIRVTHGYSRENLRALEGFSWIMRVPATLKEARALLEGEFPREAWTPLLPGYRGLEVEADYGGVRQRWPLVESEARAREEEEGLRRRVARAEGEAEKALGRLLSRRFACEADARRALAVDEEASGKLPYHRLVYLGVQEERRRGRVGRPRKGEAPLSVGYRLLARLEVDEGKLERARRGLGRFLLATDVLDREALPAGEVLGRYKDQTRTVERGFRFLKDPLFFTGSTFLKRPERVMALGMVMALALLVYALAKDPPCAGCSSSSSGCAWWSWRAGPWSSTWPPITRPRCAYWGQGDITSWSEGGAECGQHLPRLRKPLGPSLRPPLARPGRTPVSWGRPGYTLGMGAAKAVRPLGLKECLALEQGATSQPVGRGTDARTLWAS